MSDLTKCCNRTPELKDTIFRPHKGDEYKTYYYQCIDCHRSAQGGDVMQFGKIDIVGYLSPSDAATAWNDMIWKIKLRERK